MKKYVIIVLTILLFASFLYSCELGINKIGMNESGNYNAKDATNALSKLAPAFSQVIKDNPEFIPLIKEQAFKKFDDDNDVLFDTIKNLSTTKSGKTLKGLLLA